LLIPSMVLALEIDVILKFDRNGEIESVQFDNNAPITDFTSIKTKTIEGDLIRVLPLGEMLSFRDRTGNVSMGKHIRTPPVNCTVYYGSDEFFVKLNLGGDMFLPLDLRTSTVTFGTVPSLGSTPSSPALVHVPPSMPFPDHRDLLISGGRGQLIDIKSLGDILVFRDLDNRYNIHYCSWDKRVSSKSGTLR
jgi:hypothetical protein